MEQEEAGEIDIVIAVGSNSANILAAWKPLLKPHHLIIVQEEDASSSPQDEDNWSNESGTAVPTGIATELSGCDYEYYTKSSAYQFLASLSIPTSTSRRRSTTTSIQSLLLNPFKGSACRSFGFLVSRAKYIFTFDAASSIVPAQSTKRSTLVDAVAEHAASLRSPSTPFYFNTLYDPFQHGAAGFVRGYPFSLRVGVPTALSHGSCLGLPDYDTPTAIVKPHERVLRAVDAVLTLPKSALFPMSAANFAFDRRRIGACLLLRLGVGSGDDSGGVDDVWAGLCAKVTADHVGVGIKTGMPYVWRDDRDAAAAGGGARRVASLRGEFKPLLFLEEIVPFFQGLRLPRSAVTAEDCYVEIARMVRHKLKSLDPSFEKVAAAMEAWADAWKAANNS